MQILRLETIDFTLNNPIFHGWQLLLNFYYQYFLKWLHNQISKVNLGEIFNFRKNI